MEVSLAFSQTVDEQFLVLVKVGGRLPFDSQVNLTTVTFDHEDTFLGLVISADLSDEAMQNVVTTVLLSVSQPVHPQRWVDVDLTRDQVVALGLWNFQSDRFDNRSEAKTAEDTAALGMIFGTDQLAGLLLDAPTPFAVFSGPEHAIAFVNAAYLQMMGYSRRDEVNRRPIREVFPEMEGHPFFDVLDEVFRTGVPSIGTEVLTRMRTRESAEMQDNYSDFICHPMHNAAGEIAGIMMQASDVTGRVIVRMASEQREELLYSQWAELDAIYRNSPVGMLLIDAKSLRILRINERQAELMGSTIHALTGRSVAEVSDRIPEFSKLVGLVAENKSIRNTVVQESAGSDGRTGQSWLVNLRPALGMQAEVTTISSIFLEMPGVLHSQEVDVLESITDGLFVLDRAWDFIYLNSRARATLRDGDNMLGRNMWEQFPAAKELPFWDAYHMTMEKRVPTSFDVFYPDPLFRWFNIRAFPARDGMSVFFRDITDSKQEKEALHQSEERYRTLMDLNPRMPWTMSPTGEITDFGERWEEMTGSSREESLGRRFVMAVHPADVEHFTEVLERALADSLPFDVVWRLRRANGSHCWVRSRGTPVLGEDGRVLRYYGTTEDVDEIVQLRKVLEAEQV